MKKYTEKELTIFSGVLKLAREGTDLSKITARQIADAAGVGKATIYDYFSTKEEIIIKALVYAMEQQNMEMREKLASLPAFKDRMMAIFNEIIDTVENSSSIFSLLMGSGADFSRAVCSENGVCMLAETAEEIRETFRGILRRAMEKGEIACTDMTYAGMAVNGAIFATGKYRTEKRLPRRQICENAYTMLIKSLC